MKPCGVTRMNKENPIVFFGTEDFSLEALKQLVEHDYEVEAVITKPDFKKGRGKRLEQPAVKQFATSKSLAVYQPTTTNELTKVLAKLHNKIGVLVSYGKIIPQHIIEAFSHGIINVHPSLLPKYRGPSPIEAAIKNGDEKTGITIMGLDAGMDTGPIYYQEEIALSKDDNAALLYKKLGAHGARILIKVLPDILAGRVAAEPQNGKGASITHLLKKDDGLLSPHEQTADEMERQVRAYMIYPKSFVYIGDQRLIVKRARSSSNKEVANLSIKCSDGRYFIIDELINKKGKLVTGQDYLRANNS